MGENDYNLLDGSQHRKESRSRDTRSAEIALLLGETVPRQSGISHFNA